MPINNNQQGVYVSDPDNHDVPTLYAPGNLGQRYITTVPLRSTQGTPIGPTGASRSFQIVRVDSSLTASLTRGDATMWKDKAKYIVTTKVVNALNRNEVSGVMPGGATPGNYTSVQYRGPQYVKVTAADQAATVSGDSLIVSAADDGKATRIAAGTAPTYRIIGIACAPTEANGLVLADLACPETT